MTATLIPIAPAPAPAPQAAAGAKPGTDHATDPSSQSSFAGELARAGGHGDSSAHGHDKDGNSDASDSSAHSHSRRDDAPDELKPFVTLSPEPGTLYLWESWLRHEVPANAARQPRASISFNYGWR